jgi:uncharacterized membrane protein YkoI
MKRQLIFTATGLAALSLAAAGAFAQQASVTDASSPTFTGHRYARAARVSLVEARNIAMKAHRGRITDQELEKEKGGTGLRYSFDIKAADATYEVGVDARTGKVLEDSREGAHPD